MNNFGYNFIFNQKNCIDVIKINSEYCGKCRDSLFNCNELYKYRSIKPRKLNKDGYKIIDGNKVDIYQVPIINTIFEGMKEWLFSFQINDIIRIIIENNIIIDDDGNIKFK